MAMTRSIKLEPPGVSRRISRRLRSFPYLLHQLIFGLTPEFSTLHQWDIKKINFGKSPLTSAPKRGKIKKAE